ncbi:MAG: glycosyl transferase group 1 [bacterium P3]|nr:MAG: glycosyl transferase group 1 [bacterium P3]KWW42338.1 MAG: glycosyl transferase group 1 [bacterium F083]
MNILMISHYAGGPRYGMEFRSYYMALEWVRQGHRVMIVGASFSHLRKVQPAAGHECVDGIDYLWLPTRSYEGNGIGRVQTMLQFVKQVYSRRKELVAFRPDIVVASSVYTFDIYPCRHIARRAGAKLVYEVHDLWPLSPMAIGGYSKWHPFIWLLQRGENYAYRHCDMVVSMLDKALPHMQQHGLDEARFCCIPNGYLEEEWTENHSTLPETHSSLLTRLHDEGKTVVGFAGGHTASTALHVLVEAAYLLHERDDVAFVLVGNGPQKAELQHQAEQNGLTQCFFLPALDKQYVPQLLSQFDICYAGGVHNTLHRYGTSFNKITDYMLAGKPIVFSVDEPNCIVERAGCGIQVEAKNVEKVCDAIRCLADMSEAERTAIGAKGKQYATANMNYTTLSKRFIHACR